MLSWFLCVVHITPPLVLSVSEYIFLNYFAMSLGLEHYSDYTVYKGKGAMSLKVIKPTWERVPTGSGIKISRDGVLLLEFALSRGDRDYDWENKENFALSALECAEILESVEANTEKSFFHDPNKFSAGEGSVTKQLRLSPARETGWFFSLSVNYRGNPNSIRFDTIVSNAELRLIRNIMDVSFWW